MHFVARKDPIDKNPHMTPHNLTPRTQLHCTINVPLGALSGKENAWGICLMPLFPINCFGDLFCKVLGSKM